MRDEAARQLLMHERAEGAGLTRAKPRLIPTGFKLLAAAAVSGALWVLIFWAAEYVATLLS